VVVPPGRKQLIVGQEVLGEVELVSVLLSVARHGDEAVAPAGLIIRRHWETARVEQPAKRVPQRRLGEPLFECRSLLVRRVETIEIAPVLQP
jgi:hypothetical protein